MVTINAPIVEVTVFVNRARVTRRGTIHLPPGEQTIRIENLPASINPDSVRASGRGPGITIFSVDVRNRFVTETPVADTAALEVELEQLKQADKVLEDETTQASDHYQLIKALHENAGLRFARTLASGKATVETLRPVEQYLNDELTSMYAHQREIDQQRTELGKKIKAAEERLGQVHAATSREWRDIEVNVEAASESDLELEVTYAVDGASWEPVYDARLIEGKVKLTYMAQVSQQSGEHWPAAQLSLSTARQATSYTIPKLRAWYIDRYVPPPPRAPVTAAHVRASMPSPAALSEASAPGAMYAAAPIPEAVIAEAEVESSSAVVAYRVMRPIDIPSDGSPHKTTITTLTLGAQVDYMTVPKLAPEVYVRAKITNTSPVMLLPGKVLVFRGDDFVGQMQIRRSVAPNEEFEAQLGLEDRIKVDRQLTERSTARNIPGVGTQRRITVGYKLTIANNLQDSAHVLVYDQLPLPRDEVIKVRLLDSQPRPSEQSDLNVLKWEFDLPGQTRRDITYSFSLEHPRDVAITGLGDMETPD